MTKGDFTEKYWPIIASGLISIAFFRVASRVINSIEKDLSNPILTLVSIFTGVTVASITLILSQSPPKEAIHIKNFPHQCKKFVSYHISCISAGITCCFLSILAILVSSDNSIKISQISNKLFFISWMCSAFYCVFTFIRVVSLLRMLLLLDIGNSITHKDSPESTPPPDAQ